MKTQNKFFPGSKVRVTVEGLKQHARNTPAHMGYDSHTFKWRAELSKLCDSKTIGTVRGCNQRVVGERDAGFDVDFEGNLLFVPAYMIESAEQPLERIKELLRGISMMMDQSDESIKRLFNTDKKTALVHAIAELDLLTNQLPD